MKPGQRYQPCTPEIAHQTIEGEVVIVHLRSGCYYSLQGASAEVWALLEKGADEAEIVQRLAELYDHPAESLEFEVQRLVGELRAEELIRADETIEPAALSPESPVHRRPFEPLSLNKFTDMRDLILLDPIHEVDEGGWPNPREAA